MMDPQTKLQIAALDISPDRPLLIVDADEVLVHFIQPFMRYLEALDWTLRLTEYKLEYAIHRGAEVADKDETFRLVHGFIDCETHRQPMIEGAAGALRGLARDAQILVLSNVPQYKYTERVANLAGHGMAYPIVANRGPKGAALQAITSEMRAPVAFVDDSPAQIESAAAHVEHLHRVHFSGCSVLQKVMPEVRAANAAPKSWADVVASIEEHFGK